MAWAEWIVALMVAGYVAVAVIALAVEAAQRLSPARKAHLSAVALAADTLMREHRAGAYAEASRRSAAAGGGHGFAEQVRLEVARRLGLRLGIDLGTRMHYRIPRLEPRSRPAAARDNPIARFLRDVLTPADARWFAGYDPAAHEDKARAGAWRLASAYAEGSPGARLAGHEPQPATPVVLLTRRQRDCLAWAARGKSSTDIAAILNLSPHTVDEHFAEACRRLAVRTRVQAVLEATAQGLIRPHEAPSEAPPQA